jgi:hypothetical protein
MPTLSLELLTGRALAMKRLAARQMLAEKAALFSEDITIEASVKCDLEWPMVENSDENHAF